MLDERIEKFEERGHYSLNEGIKAIDSGDEDMARKRLTLAYGYYILLEDRRRRKICQSYLSNLLGYSGERISKIRERGIKAIGIAWSILGKVRLYHQALEAN